MYTFIAKYVNMENFRKREEIIDIPETCVDTEKDAFNCDNAHKFDRDCIEELIKDKQSRIYDYEDKIRKLNKQIKELKEYLEECE